MGKSLFNKIRPQKFSEIVGQDVVRDGLLEASRKKKLPGVVLFTGQFGGGKTTTAEIYAKALNCENPQNGEPCLECASCKAIHEQSTPDYIVVDSTHESGKGAIQELIESAKFLPSTLNRKVYVIDECHALSTGANNALLNILENPPEHVAFVLCTTNENAVLDTVQSRCSIYRFQKIQTDTITEYLIDLANKMSFQIDDRGCYEIARSASGSMRNAIQFFEKCMVEVPEGTQVNHDIVKKVLSLSNNSSIVHLLRGVFFYDVKTAIGEVRSLEKQALDNVSLFKSILHVCREILDCHFANIEPDGTGEYVEMIKKLSEEICDDRVLDVAQQLSEYNAKGQNYSALMVTIAKMCKKSHNIVLEERLQHLEEENKRLMTTIKHLGSCEADNSQIPNSKELEESQRIIGTKFHEKEKERIEEIVSSSQTNISVNQETTKVDIERQEVMTPIDQTQVPETCDVDPKEEHHKVMETEVKIIKDDNKSQNNKSVTNDFFSAFLGASADALCPRQSNWELGNEEIESASKEYELFKTAVEICVKTKNANGNVELNTLFQPVKEIIDNFIEVLDMKHVVSNVN